MLKYFKFVIISTAMLLLSPGCTPQTNEAEKLPQIETAKQQPAVPTKVEAPKAEVIQPKPAEEIKTEPKKEVQPPKIETAKIEVEKAVEPPKVETKKPEPKPIAPKKIKKTLIENIYDDYTDILENFVDDNGMVDYKMLKRKKSRLKTTINKFAKIRPDEYSSWTKNEKTAFWLNAYNIHLLKIISSNYPIEASRYRLIFWPPTSIRHIQGIWSSYKIIVMDEEFTLSEISNRFFKKEFDDPRIFFAISHASMSSPPLLNEPYKGKTLDKQLDDQVKKFLTCPNGFSIDRKEQTVYLSSILLPEWYGKYFITKFQTDKKFKNNEPSIRAVLNFITNYISDSSVYYLERENYSVEFTKYDWRLNE